MNSINNSNGVARKSDVSLSTQSTSAFSENGISTPANGTKVPKLKGLKDVKTKATFKAREIVGHGVRRVLDEDDHHKDHSVRNTTDDAAFHPQSAKQHQMEHAERNGTIDKAKTALETSAAALVHPRKTIRTKVKRVTAGKISSIQKPYTLPTTGTELLEAYDAYSHSEGSYSSEDLSRSEDSEDESARRQIRAKKKARVEKLEAQQDSMRVAWITRHTDRVRVVPKEHVKFPNKEAFIQRGHGGQVVQYDWRSWLGHVLVYFTQDFSVQYIDDFDNLPFDIDTMRNHAERLVMASAPWQTWAMEVRSVYRWENPYRTGKWFALYLVLWYTEHIGAFLWACILYYTIRNKFYPSSMNHLRAAIQRSADRESSAFQFGEFIDRHGRDSWLDPLIEDVGPYVQLQLGDIANQLEVLANFYSWRSPRKTASSLAFFGSCLATALFTDMAFCMKIVWFIVGGSFFLCWPVASLYPRYRYLASPFKWVLWDIPTHAEWSFQYLRRHCQESRESMIENQVEEKFKRELEETVLDSYRGRLNTPHPHIEVDGVQQDDDSESINSEDWQSADSSHNILTDASFLSYRCHWEGMIGRLAITPSGIRFVRSIKKQEMWYLPFIEVEEMRKFRAAARSGSIVLGVQWKRQLELKRTDGLCYTLEFRGDRDEVFNYIIGFSGLQWQSLQSGPQKATTHP